MALNSSGPISLGGATAGQSINLENGNSATAQVSLNDTAVRNLAGVASGAITMPTNFYGKSNVVNISYTFSANTANASLNLSSLSGYSAGKTNFTVTINSGVYLYATSTGSYGLNITGGTTGDTLVIVNNGYIMGQGGKGASVNSNNAGLSDPTAGGPALNLGFGMSSCTINNTNSSAYIGGGGGGGGKNIGYGEGAGGGAGGGDGGGGQYNTNAGVGAGGSGGSPGNSGSNGTSNAMYFKSGAPVYNSGGGGGGRVFPGTGGVPTNQVGPGGTAGGGGGGVSSGEKGGTGGSANSAGGNTNTGAVSGGPGGGGWGASGGNYLAIGPYYGASGGKAVNLNGKSVTWTSGNTTRVYGAIS